MNSNIPMLTESEWEIQEKLKNEGFVCIAPKEGTYRNINDAIIKAKEYKNSIIVCHTYCGRGKGYMVFKKK